jgi:hypothetical protein
MPKTRKIVALLSAMTGTAALSLLSLTSAAPASAASLALGAAQPSPTVNTVTATFTGTAAGTVTPRGAPSMIVCHITVDNPRVSPAPPGVVRTTGNVTCSSPMANIGLSTGLALNGISVALKSGSTSGSASLSTTAAAPCVDGPYSGVAQAGITFPPGYTPTSGNLHTEGNDVNIKCPVEDPNH